MRYEDMTIQQRRRMHSQICPVCGKCVNKFDDLQIVQLRYGRRLYNFYIHSACLLESLTSSQLGGINNEKEKVEQR